MFRMILIFLAGAVGAAESPWKPLFDGKTTKGWTPRAEVESFKAVGGELHLASKVNVWVKCKRFGIQGVMTFL